MIAEADWVIVLGPGGGDAGGRIVAQGPPEKLVRTRRRIETTRVLRGFLEVSTLTSGNRPSPRDNVGNSRA